MADKKIDLSREEREGNRKREERFWALGSRVGVVRERETNVNA